MLTRCAGRSALAIHRAYWRRALRSCPVLPVAALRKDLARYRLSACKVVVLPIAALVDARIGHFACGEHIAEDRFERVLDGLSPALALQGPVEAGPAAHNPDADEFFGQTEIGRASCTERVCPFV